MRRDNERHHRRLHGKEFFELQVGAQHFADERVEVQVGERAACGGGDVNGLMSPAAGVGGFV
jgi:hypothetical protein